MKRNTTINNKQLTCSIQNSAFRIRHSSFVIRQSPILILALSLLFIGCAQQGTLSGGAKDETPPVVLKSEPPNYSTNVSTNTFKVTFDEYFQLKNIREKLVVSPPMNEQPEMKIKGKTLEIKIIDTLQPDRTYALNFGDALVDLNESNPLDNFQVVFATGDEIDSLMVSGLVLNATDGAPGEGVVVMAYAENIDSLPLTQLPVYLSKTDEDGQFTIRNMAAGQYKIFGLLDGNNNYLFDLYDEPIAFLDSLVSPGVRWDTVKVATDSTGAVIRHFFEPLNVNLTLFTEDFSNQYLSSAERPRKDQLQFIFNEPLDSLSLTFLDTSFLPSAFLPSALEYWALPDTIDLWIMDTIYANIDTLKMIVEYPGKDSLENDVVIADTVKLAYRAPARAPEKPEKEFTLATSILRGNKHDQGKPLAISTSLPYAKIDTSKIILYAGKDSTKTPQPFNLYSDTTTLTPSLHNNITSPVHPRRTLMNTQLLQDSSYTLEVLPGAFTSLWGEKNDTLQSDFTMKNLDQYGILRINLPVLVGKGIVQLVNNKKEVIAERFLDGPGIAEFTLLNPAKYKIQLVLDANGNGKWDSGKYLEHLQPEIILFYHKELELKANWEMEETWDWTSEE